MRLNVICLYLRRRIEKEGETNVYIPYISVFYGRGVIHSISSHSNYFPSLFQRIDDFQFRLWTHTSKYSVVIIIDIDIDIIKARANEKDVIYTIDCIGDIFTSGKVGEMRVSFGSYDLSRFR